jgi:hypothetical protein
MNNRFRTQISAGLNGALLISLSAFAGQAHAASSQSCDGGGFKVLNYASKTNTVVPANLVGSTFQVRGKYIQFDVDAATFGVRNWTLTGAQNPFDITGGIPTPVYLSKLPDHRGLSLNSAVALVLKDEVLELQRSGPGLGMKIQAKDCAQGGVFQMEVVRADGTTTLFTHTLADAGTNAHQTPFYFDNRNFRNREGEVVPYGNTTTTITTRINFANDFSSNFVGRDSPQVATRRQEPGCVNQIGPNAAVVRHCGGVSRWDVASGGRMGQVMGQDAVEVSPPASSCVEGCQAQNRARGGALILGFPFQVPASDRLSPRFPAP